MNLASKRLFVTGATRGIGLAIALRAARDGASIAVVGKTAEANPKLPGTIDTACSEIEAAGGRALACVCDIRDEEQTARAVDSAVRAFGGIDILVNNASAIQLADTESLPMKRFDLMHAVNVRGTFLCSKLCIPHLKRGSNPHILVLAPPLDLEPRWFGAHLGYTLSKYGMSLCVLGLAEELRNRQIAVNALWPKTIIATAAIENLFGGRQALHECRTPEIVADAAHFILTQPSATFTGHFWLDEDALREANVTDFSRYAVDPSATPLPDLFVRE
jgi:citronellol/citronellal dehydrogenase